MTCQHWKLRWGRNETLRMGGMTSRLSTGHGLYRDATGTFWWRPTVNGRRTWRRLSSVTLQAARQERAALESDHGRARLGLARDPFAPPVPFVRDLGPLPARIVGQLGHIRLDALTVGDVVRYGEERGATRAADLEIAALSSAINRVVRSGVLVVNPIRQRPRFHSAERIRHSRECMPRDADELHAIARALLPSAVGWQLLFAALTGCRTNELLALRMDARSRQDPGWIEGRYLYVRRSKKGRSPYVELTPELAECIAAHRNWHDGRSPWWFPGVDLFRPLNRLALTHALARLPGPKRTAHGLRAYHVTVWRSRGEPDERVAARIGDRTVRLISDVYGDLPESWSGGEPLGFVPATGDPAWAPWRPEKPQNVVAI